MKVVIQSSDSLYIREKIRNIAFQSYCKVQIRLLSGCVMPGVYHKRHINSHNDGGKFLRMNYFNSGCPNQLQLIALDINT